MVWPNLNNHAASTGAPGPLWRRGLAGAAALLVVGCAAGWPQAGPSPALAADAAPARIALDAGTRYQTIDSWAVYPRLWEQDKANNRFDNSYAAHMDKISRFLIEEVGINGLRIEIWSGLENPIDHWSGFVEGQVTYLQEKKYRYEKINDNDDPFTVNPAGFQFAKFDYRFETMALPLIRALEAKGERMHINLNYVDFKVGESQGTLSHAKNPEEYAEFVLVYFQHLRDKYGIVPDTVEIVLEPENTRDWRGPEIGQAIVAVERRLKAAGFTPEIVAPSNAFPGQAIKYFDLLAQVPGAIEALDTYSYHRYSSQAIELIRGIARRAQTHGLKTAMLEKLGGNIDMLIEDLTVTQVSSWQVWGVAGLVEWGMGGGGYYAMVDMRYPDDPPIMMDTPSYHLAHVFKYVRRGAQRIGASSDNPDKRPVAFVNPNGGWAAIVRAKNAGGPLAIEGLPPGRYGVRYTGEDIEIQHWPEVTVETGRPLELELPGPGVVTVYSS